MLPPMEVVVTMAEESGVAGEEVVGRATLVLAPGMVGEGHYVDMWVPLVGSGRGTVMCCPCGCPVSITSV